MPDVKREKKQVRVSKGTYAAISEQISPYLLLKGEEYRTGDIIIMQEYEKGEATGEENELFVSHIDDSSTHTAIADGYCVLGDTGADDD